jgi:hypothetical protein
MGVDSGYGAPKPKSGRVKLKRFPGDPSFYKGDGRNKPVDPTKPVGKPRTNTPPAGYKLRATVFGRPISNMTPKPKTPSGRGR